MFVCSYGLCCPKKILVDGRMDGLQMQKHIQKCAECLVNNLQEKAEKNEIFDFKE